MADVLEKEANFSTTDVTVTTTTETVAITSPRVIVPRETCRVLIKAWALVTTGASTTALTARIRRGNAVTGTVVSGEDAKTLAAAAGGNEQLVVWAVEERATVGEVQYNLTVQGTASAANNTVLAAGIEVEILGG